uniref:Pecanex-like protein n=1 Tax=Macrostomum lignano TaxID=282301 RepID=A0A1I8IDW3_9PLAT
LPDVGSSQKSASNGPADKASQMRASKRRQFKLYASQSTVHSDDASDNSDNQGSDISDGEDSVYNPIASLGAGNNGFDRTSRQRVISNCLTEDEAEDSSSEAAASDWDSSSAGDSDPGRPADPRSGRTLRSSRSSAWRSYSAARLKPEERLRVEAMAAAREAAGEPETQL